jgi:hypothetical protein
LPAGILDCQCNDRAFDDNTGVTAFLKIAQHTSEKFRHPLAGHHDLPHP